MSVKVNELHYVRVYADAQGESHFEDCVLELTEADFAPPAPPLRLSQGIAVNQLVFLRSPDIWDGNWHPSPRRQWLMLLTGAIRSEVSDGEIRDFTAGDVILLEDTTGKGHQTWLTSSEPFLIASAQVAKG